MNNIEWKNGAVCYADGEQLFQFSGSNKLDLVDINLYKVAIKSVASSIDFQLNEPRQGDYMPKSELDTEQKYNDAVEELGLFGISVHGKGFNYLKPANTLLVIDSDWEFIGTSEDDSELERKITYVQLMAIGKLKRLMNERDKVNTSENPNSSELKDGDKYIRTIYGFCGTPVKVDVYRVSDAFPTGSAPIDHAVKKMLCAGLRGHKDKLTDIDNAIESLQAARLLLIQKGDL